MRLLTIAMFFITINAFSTGTEVGYGGDPQPIKAMSLTEAKTKLSLSPTIIRDAIELGEKQMVKKSSVLPPSLVSAIKKELQIIKSKRADIIKVIEEQAIPVTRSIRCGYKKMVRVSAFTGLTSGSLIYFSKDFLKNSKPFTLAQLLFHEAFRHVAGERINCMNNLAHQITRFIFSQKSKLTSAKIKTFWTLRDAGLSYNLILGGHRHPNIEAIFQMYQDNQDLVYYDVTREKLALVTAIASIHPDPKFTRKVFNWYLQQEMKFRTVDTDRINLWAGLLNKTVTTLIDFGISKEYEWRFVQSLSAMAKNWGICPVHSTGMLDIHESRVSLTSAAKKKIRNLKRRMRSNKSFVASATKDCPAI